MKRFEHLVANYQNLFLSCNSCNRFKDTYWSDQKSEQIVNPCDFIMSHHLKYVDHHFVEPKSDNGSVTVDKLRLNNDLSVKVRKKLFVNILATIGLLLKLSKAKSVDLDEINEIESTKATAIEWLSAAVGKNESQCRSVLKM